MKKLFTIMCALALSMSISAQSWTDRWTDDSYLPSEGEWSIGFDATSTLNYFGNLFNSGATAPTADFVDGDYEGEGGNEIDRFDQTIYGKLMTSDTEAWRVRVGLHMYKETDNTDVPDGNSSDASAMVTNKNTIGETDIKLWLGKEYRRGSTRLQGVYGAEVGLMMASTTEKNDYGNSAEYGGTGMIEEKRDGGFGFGLRGFLGVEYFLMPKISIGAEYGWGLAFISKSGGSTTILEWDSEDGSQESTTDNANDSEIGFQNDNATGAFTLRMYF